MAAAASHEASGKAPPARNEAKSNPASAKGKSPNTLSTENRPPTLGTPRPMAAQPSSVARRSSAEPGSVTATNRLPSPSHRAHRADSAASTSAVEPDLLAIT